MVKFLILIFCLFIKNNIHANEELEITADQFTYDKDNTRIYATGDVKIVDDQFKKKFDPFPNAHLRTANFLISSKDFLLFKIFPKVLNEFFLFNFKSLSIKNCYV